MPRKEKKYHFIYKTTNLLSGKYYIGMHSTDNLEDGYMGSGNRLRLAIRKHGKENFNREILEFLDNREELYLREEEIVNLDEIAKVDCINLIVGGKISGFIDEVHRKKCSDAGNDAYLSKLHNDSEFKERISKKATENNLRLIKEGKLKVPSYDWTGKSHSGETKLKMSEASKGQGTGKANSQYGTCWITDGTDNKKIKKEELDTYIRDGWVKGRFSNMGGENAPTSKLKLGDVIKIKELLLLGDLTQRKIAKMFDVNPETISKIKRGLTWRCVII